MFLDLYLFGITTAAARSQSSRPLTLPSRPPSSFPISSWLFLGRTLGLLGWYFLGGVPCLSSHRQLFHSGHKTDIRESEQLYSVYPWQNACYGKWIANLSPVHVFLSRFSICITRCIQHILTFCPFIIMLPPILWRKMFPLHNSPDFELANKAQPDTLAGTRWHLHSESTSSFLA